MREKGGAEPGGRGLKVLLVGRKRTERSEGRAARPGDGLQRSSGWLLGFAVWWDNSRSGWGHRPRWAFS